jgi:hypothetical protein
MAAWWCDECGWLDQNSDGDAQANHDEDSRSAARRPHHVCRARVMPRVEYRVPEENR